MIISGSCVEVNWKYIVTDALKFTVSVDVRDVKTSRAVKVQDGVDF
jgi:hypothetical protein